MKVICPLTSVNELLIDDNWIFAENTLYCMCVQLSLIQIASVDLIVSGLFFCLTLSSLLLLFTS